MTDQKIPFNKPYLTGSELDNIFSLRTTGGFSGDGVYTKKCHGWLEENTATARALLTHSCTAALEMSALLLDIAVGDEIIMPSFTFVSTANAFVLRGAIPVFVDIRRDTLNIDEALIEAAITPKPKAIVVVHYAGVACEMDTIAGIARRHGLKIVEDAAQGLMARYKGRALGSIGDLGTLSFHETKNVISGEGGALLVNDADLSVRAEIIREKGTDRSRFFRGEVDKYTWQDVGSSYLPSDIIAAFLWGQLQEAQTITATRLQSWETYHALFEPLEQRGLLSRPGVPEGCEHNGHIYYIVLNGEISRQKVLANLAENHVRATFHYIPLHSSPAGMKYGRAEGDLAVTDSYSERLIRLPLWVGLAADEQERAVSVLKDAISA